MEYFSEDKALELINSSKGTWFTVYFVKRTNQELRKMCGRLNVKKGTKGIGLAFDPKEKKLRTVWDRQKKEFRFVDLTSCLFIRVRKVGYFPNGETVDIKANPGFKYIGKI